MTERRFDVPNPLLDIAGKYQSVSKYLTWLLAGSSSPAYRQAEWVPVETVVGQEMPIAEASRSNGIRNLLPRTRNEVVVIGVGLTTLKDSLDFNLGSVPAAAFSYRGEVRAGLLPNSFEDLGLNDDADQALVAMRMGTNDVGVSLGVYHQSDSRLVVPNSNIVVAQHLAIHDLTTKYPGTALV